MNHAIQLRPVTMQDATLLYGWRNDVLTRQASHSIQEIPWETHLNWLEESLKNSQRVLNIAEYDHRAVGTVRADWRGDAWMLSWTIAPEARGAGHAKAMVALFAAQMKEPVCAEVKSANIASIKTAEYAGMHLLQRDHDVLTFYRSALS
ncbi:hypothetical protein TDB9533_03892 [Thalassocella blandensis]|nr:hypothetical protein TDB9533_03892 [Thalassocella blandensis]